MPSGVSIVMSLERSKKKRNEFRMKDGSRAAFPEDWNRAVAMLEEDSMSDSVFIEVRNGGRMEVTDSCVVGSRRRLVPCLLLWIGRKGVMVMGCVYFCTLT